ncbi:MAG: ACP S-malonyltransferase [Alphaproteobacteria bacterium]|nr:ACP S-malonyltransferase [Alphaproteobacteria bacterium]
MTRLLLLCPGRGSYGRAQLGSLQGPSAVLDTLDAFRAALGRPTLRQLDAAERFSPRTHLAGEHASLLTFGATAHDLEALDPSKARVVAVAGNSMGWYTALYAAGALGLSAAAQLIETMGAYQAGNVIGAQVLYPTVGEDWRPDPTLAATVAHALAQPGVYLSIRLGGTAVLGADRDGLRWLMEHLPPLQRGSRTFPLQLPLHSAFHTPLLAATSVQARADLGRLPVTGPAVTLVGGGGRVFRPWASPAAILDYTLTTQVTDTFDLTACVRTAMGSFAPDAVLLPGPGDTLGAPVAQALIEAGWRGLRDRQDFMEAQASDRPVALSMARPEQRTRVTA